MIEFMSKFCVSDRMTGTVSLETAYSVVVLPVTTGNSASAFIILFVRAPLNTAGIDGISADPLIPVIGSPMFMTGPSLKNLSLRLG